LCLFFQFPLYIKTFYISIFHRVVALKKKNLFIVFYRKTTALRDDLMTKSLISLIIVLKTVSQTQTRIFQKISVLLFLMFSTTKQEIKHFKTLEIFLCQGRNINQKMLKNGFSFPHKNNEMLVYLWVFFYTVLCF
jgi:hypothetical protein